MVGASVGGSLGGGVGSGVAGTVVEKGTLVPLSNLVSFRDAADARELGRYNKMRAITLTGSLASGYTLGEALDGSAVGRAAPQQRRCSERGRTP